MRSSSLTRRHRHLDARPPVVQVALVLRADARLRLAVGVGGAAAQRAAARAEREPRRPAEPVVRRRRVVLEHLVAQQRERRAPSAPRLPSLTVRACQREGVVVDRRDVREEDRHPLAPQL